MELKDLYDINIQSDGNFKGGIEDIGNFKEGFCLVLKGKNPKEKFKWVVCTDDPNEKFDLLKKIVILRMRIQSNKLLMFMFLIFYFSEKFKWFK